MFSVSQQQPGCVRTPQGVASRRMAGYRGAARLMGTSALPLMWLAMAGPAFGQTAAPASPPDDSGFEAEIIVTAQRREERLQDVPLAITVLSPTVLEDRRVNSSAELAQALPGIVNVSNQTSGSFAIRGQGPSFGSAPGAYVYFAEVPMLTVPTNTEPSGIDSRPGTFFDMQNVELLKGPQGTLFGRNATGGNILFVPQKPTQQLEGYVQAQVGNYKNLAGESVINVPVVKDVLAVRLSAAAETRDGYVRDTGPNFAGKDYEDVKYATGRLSVLFTPGDRFEDYFIARYYKSKSNGPAFVTAAIDPAFSGEIPDIGGLSIDTVFPNRISNFAAQTARGIRKVSYDTDVYDDIEYFQFINRMSFAITDNLSLKNILSYANTAESLGLDVDGSPDAILNQTNKFQPTPHARVYTGELQLTGTAFDKSLDFTLGAYADKGTLKKRNEDFAFFPFVPGNVGIPADVAYPLPLQINGETRSKAVFGQASLDIGKLSPGLAGLKFTAGYRYTWETGNALQLIFGDGAPGSWKHEYGSYNFTLDYQLSPTTMFYISMRDAYKSGGVNVQLDAADPDRLFAPERLVSREIGMKAERRLGSARIQVDLAAFSGSYTNIQRTVEDPARAVGAFTTNVARARIRGIELNTALRLGRLFELSENYAYTDSGYTKITDPNAVAVLTGANLPYISRHKSVTSATLHLANDNPRLGDISLSASYAYQSKMSETSTNFVGLLGAYDPAYGLWNASLTWKQARDGPFSARAFINNITNKQYLAGVYDFTSAMGFVSVRYGAPRTFGMQLKYRF